MTEHQPPNFSDLFPEEPPHDAGVTYAVGLDALEVRLITASLRTTVHISDLSGKETPPGLKRLLACFEEIVAGNAVNGFVNGDVLSTVVSKTREEADAASRFSGLAPDEWEGKK